MTTKPIVVFLVPSVRTDTYAETMQKLTVSVQEDLKWDTDSIELIGLVAATAEHGTEGIFFLEEMGISTRTITLLVLWGETAAAVSFEDKVSEECGVGSVVLPETGVILPTLRMPPVESDWWLDPLHQAYAAVVYAEMIQNGRAKREASEPHAFVSLPHTWN